MSRHFVPSVRPKAIRVKTCAKSLKEYYLLSGFVCISMLDGRGPSNWIISLRKLCSTWVTGRIMKFLYHLTPGILTSWILVLIMLNSCHTQMFIANCMFASNEQVTIAESSHAGTREALFLAWMGTLALCRVWALVNKANSLTWFKQRSSKNPLIPNLHFY